MVRINIIKQTLCIIFMALLFTAMTAEAQDRVSVAFSIQGRYGDKGTPQIMPLKFALFKTTKKASDTQKKLENAIKMDGFPGGPNYDLALDELNVNFKRDRGNGTFEVRAMQGMAVLVYLNENIFKVYEIVPGKTQYEDVVKLKLEGNVGEVVVSGQRGVEEMEITALPPTDDGKVMTVPVRFKMLNGDTGRKSRVIVQLQAIDCQTEDTVSNVTPLVYEGREYHFLQNRRMGYKFSKNDVLAPGYVHRELIDGDAFSVDTMITYEKKDIKRDYKFSYHVSAEDYTHQYVNMEKAAGSCNRYKFFKLLDLGSVTADMDKAEFRVAADENFEKVNRDMKLKFQIGKAELTNDSINEKDTRALVKELQSYGDRLINISIEASSSPDGGIETNKKLAKQRSDVAVNLVRSRLGKTDVTIIPKAPYVYTWNEVVTRMEENGKKEKADTLKHTLAMAGNRAPDAMVKQLPFYDSDVVPVLESMRAMRCTYNYERVHVMDEEEVTDYYMRNKARLMAGDKSVKLSDGDYFNLFCCLRDSAEQDTLTNIAYEYIKRQPNYHQLKLAQYIINRKAMLNLKRGTPDLELLKPYINFASPVVTKQYAGSMHDDAVAAIHKNRQEILINQIIAYYQTEERDSAASCMNYWFKDSNDPRIQRIRNYITFKEKFMKYYLMRSSLSPAEQSAYKTAEDFVLNAAPENRAVLYTEARQYMKKTVGECQELVDSMPNSSAKKWYLKGILAADEEMQRDIKRRDYIPQYLAFFYQSMKLEPSFRYLYFQEAQVNDELRKRYKYRKRDIPKYEEMMAAYLNGNAVQQDDEISGNDDDSDIDEFSSDSSLSEETNDSNNEE